MFSESAMWSQYLQNSLKPMSFQRTIGRLTKVTNLVIEARGVQGFIGEICKIESKANNASVCAAEIVGLRESTTLLMPYGETQGIDLESTVIATGASATLAISEKLLGRVIDPFGNPLDSKLLNRQGAQVSLRGVCHNPLNRKNISEVFETGVNAIDCFLPIGKGQRLGIFSGSGVGKSTLLGMIARNSKSDVNVIGLIGERGREVGDFLSKTLGQEGLARSVVVVATSDQPALIRELAAHTTTAIAEFFCAQNKDVLLIMDSVTRFAMAHREIGLSIGEPATARGYTPSAFSALPKLIERAGNFEGRGSITGIYTVLVEGDDLHEPISDHMRSILDGHIVLSRELANHGHYPAIDLLASISRLATDIWDKQERELIRKILKALSIRERHKDMVDIGAYRAGSNPELDHALALYAKLEHFLMQGVEVRHEAHTRQQLFALLSDLAAN